MPVKSSENCSLSVGLKTLGTYGQLHVSILCLLVTSRCARAGSGMVSLDVGLVVENELLTFCAVQSAFCTSLLGLPSAFKTYLVGGHWNNFP